MATLHCPFGFVALVCIADEDAFPYWPLGVVEGRGPGLLETLVVDDLLSLAAGTLGRGPPGRWESGHG